MFRRQVSFVFLGLQSIIPLTIEALGVAMSSEEGPRQALCPCSNASEPSATGNDTSVVNVMACDIICENCKYHIHVELLQEEYDDYGISCFFCKGSPHNQDCMNIRQICEGRHLMYLKESKWRGSQRFAAYTEDDAESVVETEIDLFLGTSWAETSEYYLVRRVVQPEL